MSGNGMFEEYTNGKGLVVRRENLFTGAWENRDYDDNGNCIYQEFSDGKWVRREYDKNNHLCFAENNDGAKTGISIREKISNDENSIDIYKLEIVCDNYPKDTILRGLTLEQKDMICDYVEQTIDYGYANKISDNIGNLYNAITEERGKETVDKQEKRITEFSILQIPSRKREFLFKDIAMLENGIDDVDANNYTSVFSSHFDKIIDLNDREQVSDALEELFLKYNDCNDPNYKGRSLSVSDVVVLKSNTSEKAYYCNNFGWNTLPDKFVSDWNNKNNNINISNEHSENNQTKDEIDFEY